MTRGRRAEAAARGRRGDAANGARARSRRRVETVGTRARRISRAIEAAGTRSGTLCVHLLAITWRTPIGLAGFEVGVDVTAVARAAFEIATTREATQRGGADKHQREVEAAHAAQFGRVRERLHRIG